MKVDIETKPQYLIYDVNNTVTELPFIIRSNNLETSLKDYLLTKFNEDFESGRFNRCSLIELGEDNGARLFKVIFTGKASRVTSERTYLAINES